MEATPSKPAVTAAPAPAAHVAQFNALMTAFVKENQIADWTPSTDGCTDLILGDGSRVRLLALAKGPQLAVGAEVAPLPSRPQARSDFCAWLLRQNEHLPDGLQLVIDDGHGVAMCQRRLALTPLNSHDLGTALTALLAQADRLAEMDGPQLSADDVEG